MLEGFNARHHVAELVAPGNSALGERAAARGIKVHTVSSRTSRISAALKISELTRHHHPDDPTEKFALIHANEALGATSAWLARAHRQIPLVVSRRGPFPLKDSVFARSPYRAAANILPISEWVAAALAKSGMPSDKLAVVYAGVELPRIPPPQVREAARARWGINDNSPLIGCVGFLLPDKGQDSLIRTLAALRSSEFPNAKLLLAGDGPDKPRLKKIVVQLDLQDAVIFGDVTSLESLYPAFDLFIFPSRFEGLGTSLLEAMSYAIPSIAFATCAFPEVIEHGRSGLLAEPGNETSLANSAAAILRNPEIARQIGQSGRLRIEQKFSARQMVDTTLSVYESLLPRIE